MPSATPQELAAAIIECIDAGARVINLSLALAQPSTKGEQSLEEALNQAVRRGVIVVAAAGNQGTLGSSAITRHPWVIPVVACDVRGRPMNESNLGSSIGRRGLSAPGDGITSLGAEGQPLTLGGTSVAVPFVTGAIALLWSEFPVGDRGANQTRRYPGIRTAASLGGSAVAGCRGGLPNPVDSECEEVNSMTKASEKQGLTETRANARLTGAPARIYHRRGDRAWRCHQTSYFVFRDPALRRLRTPGGRTQPLDGFHPSTPVEGIVHWIPVCNSPALRRTI